MARFTLNLLLVLFSLLLVGCTGPAVPGQEGQTGEATQEVATVGATPIPGDRFDCAAAAIPALECQALVAFYEATGGPDWQESSGWLQTTAPCTWSGVTCNGGHVEMLQRFANNLQGELPSALADLTRLRVLDLHDNALTGPIPAQVSRLASLEYLDLSLNCLDGTILETVGDLASLQTLSLAHNQLGGSLPAALGQIVTLRNLDLSYNQLDGDLPPALAHLTALETLRLRANQLAGQIPVGLADLPALSEIDLTFNHLAGPVPAALNQIPIHRLWGNRLDGTIFVDVGPQKVSYLGTTFTLDAAVAGVVWPELVPARAPEPGPGVPWAPGKHIIFTLTRADGPEDHSPLGLYLPSEAQIHVYATAGLNPEVQPTVVALRQLLADPAALSAYAGVAVEAGAPQPEMVMLPPTNAAQTFRAQVELITFAGGRGVRYLTQLSQGPVPVNNQDLFYTFQGLSDDGATYLAAYFPVSFAGLPATPQIDEAGWTTLLADWPGYLAETVATLAAQPAAAFTPDLAALDALLNSFSVARTTARPDDGLPTVTLATGAVATGFQVETVAAVPASDQSPYWEVLPAYTRVTLLGYPLSDHLMQPQIFIYPLQALQDANESTVPMVASLQTLLQSPQEIPTLPFLPLFNAAQVMHVHLQYLDFHNGQGLRYLTEFDQGIVPINNYELIYTYQGLTVDGRYYVAAVLPVTHPSLPPDGTVTGNEPPAFATDFPTYLAGVVGALNPQAATTFTPDLTALDAMISSLLIQ